MGPGAVKLISKQLQTEVEHLRAQSVKWDYLLTDYRFVRREENNTKSYILSEFDVYSSNEECFRLKFSHGGFGFNCHRDQHFCSCNYFFLVGVIVVVDSF